MILPIPAPTGPAVHRRVTRLWLTKARRAKSHPWPNGAMQFKKRKGAQGNMAAQYQFLSVSVSITCTSKRPLAWLTIGAWCFHGKLKQRELGCNRRRTALGHLLTV